MSQRSRSETWREPKQTQIAGTRLCRERWSCSSGRMEKYREEEEIWEEGAEEVSEDRKIEFFSKGVKKGRAELQCMEAFFQDQQMVY